MIFDYILKNKDGHSIEKMCQVLKVSCSGYYKHKKLPPSKRSIQNTKLLSIIEEKFYLNKKRYGSPRMYQLLISLDHKISLNKVARMMKNNGLYAKKKKRFRITTDSNHKYYVSPNILKRNFNPKLKNQVWVSDITYLWTDEGWIFLCTIIDLFNKKVVGWALSNSLSTELVLTSFEMAVMRENPSHGLIFHSDRGVQYTAKEFRSKLKSYKMVQSMSRKGNCWDNAPAESFFSTIKTELIYMKNYKTREEVRNEIFEYIEIYYNRVRLHSSLGFLSPLDYENKLAA